MKTCRIRECEFTTIRIKFFKQKIVNFAMRQMQNKIILKIFFIYDLIYRRNKTGHCINMGTNLDCKKDEVKERIIYNKCILKERKQ